MFQAFKDTKKQDEIKVRKNRWPRKRFLCHLE